jgi:recombinase
VDALQLVFAKFAEFQSARQVHIWLRDEGIKLPVKSRYGETRGVVWRLPAYNIVHNILTNPIYAGAYAFGRTTSKVSVEQGARQARRASANGRMGCSDQGSSRDLHHLGGVREEPRAVMRSKALQELDCARADSQRSRTSSMRCDTPRTGSRQSR